MERPGELQPLTTLRIVISLSFVFLRRDFLLTCCMFRDDFAKIFISLHCARDICDTYIYADKAIYTVSFGNLFL